MGSVVSSNKHNLQFILINVYGPIQTSNKQKVWDDISAFMELYPETNIIIGGDFNTILDLKEKYGGSHILTRNIVDFREWVRVYKLIEIPTSNEVFTWNNRRKDFNYIAEKLDRFFFKGELVELDLTITTSIQPIAGSDHYPVKIELTELLATW